MTANTTHFKRCGRSRRHQVRHVRVSRLRVRRHRQEDWRKRCEFGKAVHRPKRSTRHDSNAHGGGMADLAMPRHFAEWRRDSASAKGRERPAGPNRAVRALLGGRRALPGSGRIILPLPLRPIRHISARRRIIFLPFACHARLEPFRVIVPLRRSHSPLLAVLRKRRLVSVATCTRTPAHTRFAHGS